MPQETTAVPVIPKEEPKSETINPVHLKPAGRIASLDTSNM